MFLYICIEVQVRRFNNTAKVAVHFIFIGRITHFIICRNSQISGIVTDTDTEVFRFLTQLTHKTHVVFQFVGSLCNFSIPVCRIFMRRDPE